MNTEQVARDSPTRQLCSAHTHKAFNMPQGIYLTSTLNRLIFLPYLTRQAETKSCPPTAKGPSRIRIKRINKI